MILKLQGDVGLQSCLYFVTCLHLIVIQIIKVVVDSNYSARWQFPKLLDTDATEVRESEEVNEPVQCFPLLTCKWFI